MTVRYRDLAGASYEDVWTMNPLLYEGETITGYKGMNDLVEATQNLVEVVKKISSNVGALTGSRTEVNGDENERREA